MENSVEAMSAPNILWVIAAFILTLALIALTAFVARKLLTKMPMLGARTGGKARLDVVEWRPLDGKHQLYLVRRDDTEHLLLLSATGNPVVVEKNIHRTADRPVEQEPDLRSAYGGLRAARDVPLPLGPASLPASPPLPPVGRKR